MRKCSKVKVGVKVAGRGDCSKCFGREWKSLNGFRQALNQTLSQMVGPRQFKEETPPPFFFNFHTIEASLTFPCEYNRNKAHRLHQLSPC